MEEKMLLGMLRILPVIGSGIVFSMVWRLGRGACGRRIIKNCEEIKGMLAEKSRDSTWYQRTEEWLLRKGVAFHVGRKVSPMAWLSASLLMALLGFFMGVQFTLSAGIVMASFFYGIPRLLVQYMDYRDNERMTSELKQIYHGLEIQIRAGVYVTDALAECYAGVGHMRLRQALLDLAGAVTVKADVYEALNHFQCSFDNRYVDALCITLLQAMESGQAVELLSDIAEQVKDMEVSVMGRRKGALDRSLTFYQLGILAAVLGVVLYACITQMFSAVQNF